MSTWAQALLILQEPGDRVTGFSLPWIPAAPTPWVCGAPALPYPTLLVPRGHTVWRHWEKMGFLILSFPQFLV